MYGLKITIIKIDNKLKKMEYLIHPITIIGIFPINPYVFSSETNRVAAKFIPR